jgi:hypothetical protein
MQKQKLALLAVVSGLIFASSITPAQAQAPAPLTGKTSALFGIETAGLSPGNAQQIKASGASWVRRNALKWSDVEPQEGARNWAAVAALEAEMKLAASQGFNFILVVRSTPAWAQARSGVSCGAIVQDKLSAFGAFMRDAVSRYSKAPFNVRFYELWNEPDVDPAMVPPDNIFGCWGDASDPFYGGGVYAEALKAAYPQVKAANRRAQLWHGGLLLDCDPDNPPAGKDCRSARFFEGVLQAGGSAYFDAVSFHAYDFYSFTPGQYANPNWASAWNSTGPVIEAKSRFLRSLLGKYGAPRKPLINTETGLLCWECTSSPPEFEMTKAFYVPQAYAMARAERLIGNIWYSLEGWFQTQLVNADGSTTDAYTAMQVASGTIGRATAIQPKNDLEGIRGYQFTAGGIRYWLLWSVDGQSRTVRAPVMNRRAFDHLGRPVQVNGQSVTIDAKPVYIQVR